MWALGMDRNLCDQWSLQLEVYRSSHVTLFTFSVQNTSTFSSAVRPILMQGSHWSSMAGNLSYQRQNNSSICYLSPKWYKLFLHRLLHSSIYFFFLLFLCTPAYLLSYPQIKKHVWYIKKIEYYIGKADCKQYFPSLCSIKKKRNLMFFKTEIIYFVDEFKIRKEKFSKEFLY